MSLPSEVSIPDSMLQHRKADLTPQQSRGRHDEKNVPMLVTVASLLVLDPLAREYKVLENLHIRDHINLTVKADMTR